MAQIGIVVPILNEETCLTERRAYYQRLSQHAPLVFVDGGSNDNSVVLAKELGEVVQSPRGRAVQKNAGAAALDTPIILFLHVDTRIDMDALKAIELAVHDGSEAGCLTMTVSDGCVMVEACAGLVNMRARCCKVMDGDLGLFVRRDVFDEMGGFDDAPIMEDIFFGDKLKQQHRSVVMLPHIIDASARKWYEKGFWTTLIQYTWIYGQYWMGQIKPRRSHE